MKWDKLGLLFRPQGQGISWMHSHCQLPVADPVGEDLYKVYFASRDPEQRSRIGTVTFDIKAPDKILDVSEKPVLEPGPIGYFDEHGVFPSSILDVGGYKYLYYIGWNQGAEPPLFYANIGLAISEDGGETFYKYSRAPIMQRSEHDPCLVTSPQVIYDKGVYRMYYVSGIRWERVEGKLKSFYHIKYAESENGIDWEREGRVAIDFEHQNESNIARPSVLKEGGGYHMWYSFVAGGKLYRMGYARSEDGYSWKREDDSVGIDVSPGDFDSDMVCYPHVFWNKGQKFMVYNGNFFGKEGFALARSLE